MLNENILTASQYLLSGSRYNSPWIYVFFFILHHTNLLIIIFLGMLAVHDCRFAWFSCTATEKHMFKIKTEDKTTKVFLFFLFHHSTKVCFQTFIITGSHFVLRFPLLQNFCLPPFITGRFVTAASLFVLFPPLHSSPFVSSQFSSWHCPQLRSSLHMGIIGSDLAERCHMMPTCVWCFAGTPLTQEMLPAFFPPSCSAAESRALQLNPVSVLQSIPHWFQPLPGYRLPQTMRLCYNFRLAGAMGIKLWTTKSCLWQNRGAGAPQ